MKSYFGLRSVDDLKGFWEAVPRYAGQTVLVAAGIAWAVAAIAGLYTTIQTQKLIELRSELRSAEALRVSVGKINYVPLPEKEVVTFVNQLKRSYGGLDIYVKDSRIIITSDSTANFSEFREAIGHVQNGGDGWRITLDMLCVGRECDRQFKLAASLKVNKVSVEKTS